MWHPLAFLKGAIRFFNFLKVLVLVAPLVLRGAARTKTFKKLKSLVAPLTFLRGATRDLALQRPLWHPSVRGATMDFTEIYCLRFQTNVRRWSNSGIGQKLVRCWSEVGQKVVRCRSEVGLGWSNVQLVK